MRTDVSTDGISARLRLTDFMRQTNLDVFETNPVNLFGYWPMLRAHNNKRTVSELMPLRTDVGKRIESGLA